MHNDITFQLSVHDGIYNRKELNYRGQFLLSKTNVIDEVLILAISPKVLTRPTMEI